MASPKRRPISNGRGDRIRTYDPWTPRPVRYQTAPRPDTLLVLRLAIPARVNKAES